MRVRRSASITDTADYVNNVARWIGEDVMASGDEGLRAGKSAAGPGTGHDYSL